MNDVFMCPISIGELIDKLTILDIKLKYISDNRKSDVEKEFNLLYSQISDKIDNYKYYYDLMKKINKDIWHLMDKIREIDFENNKEIWIKYCKQTIDYNDIRFRIKNKINTIFKSNIKEQKGYKINTYHIHISDTDDITKCIIAIQYLSLIYDVVEVQCSQNIYEKLYSVFLYDSSITYNKNNAINSSDVNIIFSDLSNNELFKLIYDLSNICN